MPYKIHIILTANGIKFTFPPGYTDGPTATYITHMFDMRCRENGIEHRLTKVKHPWTNGQVERMNRTINAYNYGWRFKTLKDFTPYEYICKIWTNDPKKFKLNSIHQMLGLNS